MKKNGSKKVVMLGVTPERQPVLQEGLNGFRVIFANSPENAAGEASGADVMVVNVDEYPGFVGQMVRRSYSGKLIGVATRSKTMNSSISLSSGEKLWPVTFNDVISEIQQHFAS